MTHAGPGAGALLAETKRLLVRAGLKARKGLGQHFLIDAEVLAGIVAAAELSKADTVIEVGPGLGALTRELAARTGRVVAVELDDNLAALLKQDLASLGSVTIVNQDILETGPSELLRQAGTEAGSITYKVVANLPYYITSPVLRHFLEAPIKPSLMVVMVQKEVAKEIVATPGQMSLLTISVQLYGKPSIVAKVPASSFYPPPAVDSAIVRIDVYPRPVVDVEVAGFFAVVRAGFSAARKQLVNSLARGLELSKDEAQRLLEQAAISPQRRAESLSLEEWARLWHLFSER